MPVVTCQAGSIQIGFSPIVIGIKVLAKSKIEGIYRCSLNFRRRYGSKSLVNQSEVSLIKL